MQRHPRLLQAPARVGPRRRAPVVLSAQAREEEVKGELASGAVAAYVFDHDADFQGSSKVGR